MIQPLKHLSQNVLEAFLTNVVDPDQTCVHSICPLNYISQRIIAKNCKRQLKQTAFSDKSFHRLRLSILSKLNDLHIKLYLVS